jgi:hypothetical protein
MQAKNMCKSFQFRSFVMLWAFGAATLALSGCDDISNPLVVSLQPFYTDADVETDARLIGSWTNAEGEVTFTFEPGQESGYKLTVREKDGEREATSEFEAHLTHFGSFRFVDFYPGSIGTKSEFYGLHLLRGHSLARIEHGQDSLELKFFNANWLEEKFEEKSADMPHLSTSGTLLLTGTTEELQELVYPYSTDEEAFVEPLKLQQQSWEESREEQ